MIPVVNIGYGKSLLIPRTHSTETKENLMPQSCPSDPHMHTLACIHTN